MQTNTLEKKRYPLLYLGAALFALFILLHIFMPQKSEGQSPLPVKAVVESSAATTQSLAAMDTQINDILVSYPKLDVTATIIDSATGKTKNYGPDVPYEAASVAKLITAAAIYNRLAAGTVQTTQKLEDGNTISKDIRNMVVNSDNAAWQSLTDQLTLNSLNNYAKQIGINDYNLSNNSLTTKDIASVLHKLYAGTLLNKTYTAQLLGYMKVANEADLIPPVVPAHATVYHKAGLLDDRVHDAAIIDDGKHAVIVVVFTNGHGQYDFPTRTNIIQSIAKSAFTAYDIQ